MENEGQSQWQLAADPSPTVTVVEGGTVEGQDLALKPPPTLKGVVLLPDGQPAAGATVQHVGNYAPVERSVVANADGTFAFKVRGGFPGDQPEETASVFAQAPERGLAGLVQLSRGQEKVEVKLQPGAWLTTTVVDQDEKPLADFTLQVLVQPEGQQQTVLLRDQRSDAQGKLRMGPLPAGVPVRAMVDWGSSHLVMSEEWQRWEPYTLSGGEERALPQLQVNPRGRSLKVYVGDEQQKPVGGAKIYVGQGNASATTDEKGLAELAKLPLQGKVTVIAVHPSLPLLAAETVDPAWDYWPGLILKPLGSATGQLVDPAGKPVAGMPVSCDTQMGMYFFDWQLRQRLGMDSQIQNMPKTDENGRFTMTGLVDNLEYSMIVWTVVDPNRRTGSHVGKFLYRAADAPMDLGQFTFRPPTAE